MTRKNLRVAAAAIGVAVLGIPAPAQAATPHAVAFTSLCGAMAGSKPSGVKHVMFILEENKSYRQVIGNPSTLGDPYINNVLVPSCGLATNYHNYSHPSLPNYLALTSGTAKGSASDTDCSVVTNCPQSQASIFSQLGNAGRSWREYAQSMPSNCYPSNDGYYLVRHAPPPYYTSSPVPSECKNWDMPLGTATSGAFINALSQTSDRLPAFSFVTPNECNGADKAAGERCWNSTHANTSLFPSCWVTTLVLSPYTGRGTRSGSYFSHLGLLGTAEDMLGLPRLATTSGY